MPSMVIFKAPFGMPFTVELRGVVGVEVPGASTSSSTALRVAKGRSVSWRPVRLLLTSAVCACTISAPAVTWTVSEVWPTSSLTFTVPGTPTIRVTLSTVSALKPAFATITR